MKYILSFFAGYLFAKTIYENEKPEKLYFDTKISGQKLTTILKRADRQNIGT